MTRAEEEEKEKEEMNPFKEKEKKSKGLDKRSGGNLRTRLQGSWAKANEKEERQN